MGLLGDVILKITKTHLLRGCLVSSIAHAIMTNIYPELSFEQSWDGRNFSMNNGNGIRGTITFLERRCVGAIRNEKGDAVCGNDAIGELINCFPEELINIAKVDTLQYLLNNSGGEILPVVTSAFWCDEDGLRWASRDSASFTRDFQLFQICTLSQYEATVELQRYYGMNEDALNLLCELVALKSNNYASQVILDSVQKAKLPGNGINQECRESFQEIKILC